MGTETIGSVDNSFSRFNVKNIVGCVKVGKFSAKVYIHTEG